MHDHRSTWWFPRCQLLSHGLLLLNSLILWCKMPWLVFGAPRIFLYQFLIYWFISFTDLFQKCKLVYFAVVMRITCFSIEKNMNRPISNIFNGTREPPVCLIEYTIYFITIANERKGETKLPFRNVDIILLVFREHLLKWLWSTAVKFW